MTSLAKRFVAGVAAFAFTLGMIGFGPRPASADPVDGRLDGEARRRAIAIVRSVESDLAAVVHRVTDASVTILTRRQVGRERRRGFVAGAGSGTLIHYRGTHVLTNNHVVSHNGDLEIVTSGGRVYPVRVLARDRANDLAVLSIDAPDAHLKPVDLERRASTRLREGAWVVATGNPFLLAIDGGAVATLGVFSGTRIGPSSSMYLLQHDAEINPGNSGGPLWNLDGELLGVNGAIVTRSMMQGAGPSYTGASISVPVARVRGFLDRVLPKTSTPPGAPPSARREPVSARAATTAADRIGLSAATSLDPATDRPDGVLVMRVVKGGLVASSGQARKPQPGDRITAVTIDSDTTAIRSIRDLEQALGARRRGTVFTLRFERDGSSLTWSSAIR
jgi:serine protease Do